MNTKRILTSVVASAALILPATLAANAGDRGTTSASGQHSGSNTSMNQGWAGSSSSTAKIQHVNEDDLKHRVTADDLKGKDVVDRDGKKIGEVKDIGLTQVVGSSTRATTSGMSSGAAAPASSSTASMPNSSQANLFVELEDEVEVGDREFDYAVIPASQVTFDREEGQVRLNIAHAELAASMQR